MVSRFLNGCFLYVERYVEILKMYYKKKYRRYFVWNQIVFYKKSICNNKESVFYIFKKVAFVLSVLFLTACNVNNQIQGTFNPTTEQDFQKTEIIANGPVPANGTSPLLVAVHLKNSNNTSVPDFKPTYSISSGAGVTSSDCTTSDSNGVSACILKAVVSGTKTFTLTNALVGLSKNIVFDAAAGTEKTEILTGATANGTTGSGYKVQMALGHPLKGNYKLHSGGYKVKFSGQGVVQ